MEINWFTFTAQIVNFLILIWLLKRFLYTPLQNVMKNREDEVLSRLEEARQKLVQAEEMSNEYQEKMDQLEEQKEEWLEEAKKETESFRKELLQTARNEVDAIHAKWLKAVESEKRSLIEALERQSVQKILSIVEKIVIDLSDAELEQQTIKRFLEKVKAKDEEGKTQLEKIRSEKEIEIVSSFPLEKADRQKIDTVIQGVFSDQTIHNYTTDPDLGFGIELQSNGWKLGWNMKMYLKELRSEVDTLLDQTFQSRSE
jgi:F-type H+-transporting ATPase subunit b